MGSIKERISSQATGNNGSKRRAKGHRRRTPAPAVIQLDVPLADPPTGGPTEGMHIELHLDRVQSAALREVIAGCDQTGARLDSGRRVVNRTDSLRWLLEQVAKNPVNPKNPV